MTCDIARDELLSADLSSLDADSPALAAHLRDCQSCSRLARALGDDVARLRTTVRRRTANRRRIATAVALTTAAAVIVIVVLRVGAKPREPIVAAAPAADLRAPNVISVHVDPGKQAAVFKTSDPTVTVVWLNDGGEP